MRGGFVACLGAKPGALEIAIERLRWHRGSPAHYHAKGLEIAAYVDPVTGPFVESVGGTTTLVHGAAIARLTELQANSARFAALQWDGILLRVARDPMGLAPLFYRVVDTAMWLATEVAPLLSLGSCVPDLEALCARAAFVPLDERSGWSNIFRVLPGTTLEIDVATMRTQGRRYWSVERSFGAYRGGYQDAVAEFRSRFDTAVRRCLEPRSAVLLSGGLDSAAVAIAAGASGHTVPHLVHVHYPHLPKTHEQAYAASVALAVGARLHTVTGHVTPWDIGAELAWHGVPYSWLPYGMDEPMLAHIAEAGIGLALDGHDGDGVLGAPGGAVWGNLLLHGELQQLWKWFRHYGANRALRSMAADLVPYAVRPARYRPSTYMHLVAPYFREPMVTRILHDDIQRWRWPTALWQARQLQPLLPRALISFEQKEIEAASHGIDLRHPFADRELVEFLISLPCHIKNSPGRAKPLLVDAFANELPQQLHQRHKSDYMTAVSQRVDARQCVEVIRTSGVRLPLVNYPRLLAEGESRPDGIPLFLLVNLARVHAFAGWHGESAL